MKIEKQKDIMRREREINMRANFLAIVISAAILGSIWIIAALIQ